MAEIEKSPLIDGCPECGGFIEFFEDVDLGLLDDDRLEVNLFCVDCNWRGTAKFACHLVEVVPLER